MARKVQPLDRLVRARTATQNNQTGSGKHTDRRTRRNRDRSNQRRRAITDSRDS